jgi:endoribonuclease Dicer
MNLLTSAGGICTALLDFYVIRHYYGRFPDVSPRQLSLLKQTVVCNGSLGYIALTKLEVQKYLLHGSVNLEQAVHRAVREVATSFQVGRFAEAVWLWEPAKVLGDVVEALLGAVFVDSGHSLEATDRVLDRLLGDILPILGQDVEPDYISRITTWRQKVGCVRYNERWGLEKHFSSGVTDERLFSSPD